MSAAERVYAFLLRAYPADFRAAYGREMALLFRDLRRDRRSRGAWFWGVLLWDVAQSAPALRLAALRDRWLGSIQPTGVTMRTMAVFAVLIGLFELVGAVTEGWAGGIADHDRVSLAAGAMGVFASLALLGAGVALLRRTRGAPAQAAIAASVGLVTFVLMTFLTPRMGVAATGLGIGFPLVLLIFLGVRGRGGPSVHTGGAASAL